MFLPGGNIGDFGTPEVISVSIEGANGRWKRGQVSLGESEGIRETDDDELKPG